MEVKIKPQERYALSLLSIMFIYNIHTCMYILVLYLHIKNAGDCQMFVCFLVVFHVVT